MLSGCSKRKPVIPLCLILFSPLFLFAWDLFGPDPESFDWKVFEEMNLRNTDMPLYPGFYPIPPKFVDNFIDPARDFWANETQYLFGGKRRAWGFDFYPTYRIYDNTSSLPSLEVGAGADWERFGLYSSYLIDRAMAKDPGYTGKKWRGFAGEAKQLGIAFFPAKNWYLMLGRDKIAQGSGFVISRYHRPLDGAYMGWFSPNFRLLFVSSFLDRYHTREGDINRYLAFHRFEYANRHFSASASEIVVYGGLHRLPEWYYIIPAYFYHGEQLNREYDDNTLLLFDFRVRYLPIYFSTEFLLDDVQIERRTREDKAPMFYGVHSELRYMTGFFRKPFTAILSYNRVSNWTFNQRKEWNRLLYYGKPIGDTLGNDYDRATAEMRYFFCPNLCVGAQFELVRRGEGRINAIWSTPWIYVSGEYKEKFPTGTVESSYILKGVVAAFYKRWFRAEANLGYMWRRNVNNREGVEDKRIVCSLKIGALFEFAGNDKKGIDKLE